MSDNIILADINLPLLKWMISFKLNRDLFSTNRNQSLKSINEIYRDLQYNIIPPKDEELQNLWIHLYDLNNYYSNSIEYNQVEKSLISLKSKYRNSYLKGYYEITNWFQSIANDFDPTLFYNNNNNNNNSSITDKINNRKNENKENSFKFLSSFESYVPTVEEIKKMFCIDNKEILIDKTCGLPVEYKLFHGFSLLHLYVFLIIITRIFKLINEIYRPMNGSDNQDIVQLLRENLNLIKSIEEFLNQLKSNNLYYIPNKKEIILKYSILLENNNNNNNNNNSDSNNNSGIGDNSNDNDNDISILINNSSSSLIINQNIKTFEFSEKELKYSKRYYNYNEFTLRPGELPNNSSEIQHLIFYTTMNYYNSNNNGGNNNGSGSGDIDNNSNNNNNNNSSNSLSLNPGSNSSGSLLSKNKFKINYHKPKDIKPKIVLAIYNNILSMSKVLDNNIITSVNEIINSNNNNNNNNQHNSEDEEDDDDEELSNLEFGSEIIEQVKECYICRFRSEFIFTCNYCPSSTTTMGQFKMVCDLCSINKTCWECYFKKDEHFIPLEVVVKLKDRKYPRLIYMLLKSYSFRDLMNTLYQDRFERDTTISFKDRLTYKLHKTKLYNFHLVVKNPKNSQETKEIKIFDDYSLIISIRLLMNYILSNYIIVENQSQQQQQQQPIQIQTSPSSSFSIPSPNNRPQSPNSLLEHAISRSYNNSLGVGSSGGGDIDIDGNSTSGSNTGTGGGSNTGTGSGGGGKFYNNQRKNSNTGGSGTGKSNGRINSDNEMYNSSNNNNSVNQKIINNNIIVTIENPLFWNIDKFTLNITEQSIDIEQSLRIPSTLIETDLKPFASGGQANIYMVKHIDWPMLSNCPPDSFVFKQFIENKDSLQLEEDKEREIYEEKIYQTYKTGEAIDNFKYNFSNVEQTDKKSLETLFYEEVDKLKKLQFSKYIIKMPAISDDNHNRRGMLLECATAGSLKTNLLEYRSWKLVIRFMMDICLGMIDIHKCGIIHRDLKPDNILVFENTGIVTATGASTATTTVSNSFSGGCGDIDDDERQREFGGLVCKITDLGASIQKELVHDNNFTSTFHTDDYVPEEYGKYQYDGEKVDLYSFGCTFFEMVTKHRYQYKHPTPLHRDFLTTDFQYIPIRIKSLIASLLADASQRKQTFTEVYNDLQDIYKNVIPGLPDIPYNPKSTNGNQFCKRCNPPPEQQQQQQQQ